MAGFEKLTAIKSSQYIHQPDVARVDLQNLGFKRLMKDFTDGNFVSFDYNPRDYDTL